MISAKRGTQKYSLITKSRESHWNDLREFFAYPEEIRKAIYTANAREPLNFSLRQVIKDRATSPTDDAIHTVMYLAIPNMDYTRQ